MNDECVSSDLSFRGVSGHEAEAGYHWNQDRAGRRGVAIIPPMTDARQRLLSLHSNAVRDSRQGAGR